MSRNLPFLAAMLALVVLGPAVSAAPLTVNPSNPRYFTDGSGKAIYLTGSHTWNNLQDISNASNLISKQPTHSQGFDAYLNFLKSYNHNFIRMWILEHAWDQRTDERSSPHPYKRTGPGNALDGLPKFDLTQFNDDYFNRLRQYVIAARNKGIYVSVMFFGGMWGTEHVETWKGHIFNKDNNVQGINGDVNGDGMGNEIYDLSQAPAAVIEKQKKYIEKVIDTVNDLDNVIYEIANEVREYSTSWQYEMINYIKSYESGKPKQHPVGMTGCQPIPHADLLNSPADWISPSPSGGDYKSNPPAADGSKVIVIDTDHLWGEGGNSIWVWKSFTRGLNPIFMERLRLDSGDIPNSESIRNAMGYTLTYANKMNLVSMTPGGDLASTGYALANPGSEYLVYQPGSGSFTVNLQAGTYNYEWFNPAAGSGAGTGNITANGGSRSFSPPFSGDAVLYLKKTSTNPYCGDGSCNGAETCSNCPNDCGACPSINPVAWWKFDESSGTTASDSSGNGNTGTLTNGPTWTTGKISNALSFDGVDDYVVSPHAGMDKDVGTLSMWVKPNFALSALLYFFDSDTARHAYYSTGDGSTITMYNDDRDTRFNISSFTAGQWYHVVFVWTKTGNVQKLYWNGVEQSVNQSIGTWDNNNIGTNIYIGARISATETFKGLIDDVRIYNRALNQSEIQNLYNFVPHKSDTNGDGCTDTAELSSFISRWQANSSDVILKEIIEAIGLWKRGC